VESDAWEPVMGPVPAAGEHTAAVRAEFGSAGTSSEEGAERE